MDGDADLSTPAARLKRARERYKKNGVTFRSIRSAALHFGWNENTYKSHELGLRRAGGLPEEDARKYAKAFGVSLAWLMTGEPVELQSHETGDADAAAPVPVRVTVRQPLNVIELKAFIADRQRPTIKVALPGKLRPIDREIPVMGDVAAGLWKEADSRELWHASEHIKLDVQGYERASLYAMRVVGNSMNLVYRAGRYVIVAPTAEAGLRVGDYVVVEREKAGLVEITVKQLESENGRAALWPRSDDPEFQTPIYLTGDHADQARPRIIGVVVADYARADRPPANGMFELPESYAE